MASSQDKPMASAVDFDAGGSLLQPLLQRAAVSGPTSGSSRSASRQSDVGVRTGELIALTPDGGLPVLLVSGPESTGALVGRSVVDLHGAHIGAQVVLSFENGDPALPIVMGVLARPSWPSEVQPAQVTLEADGMRMVVDARDELVLRCGKASITLKRSGKVTIEGTSVLTRATGVIRIKGGSIELN